jgi:uncharacterized DUF497 family protein
VSVENCRYGKAKGKRQEARVKRVWAILHFFTQFGFIVFTYLVHTERNGKIRLISARKATPKERRQYYEYLAATS